MSLRRRITAAAAFAVAAVAIALGAIGYLETRSHLSSAVKQELHERAGVYLLPHQGGNGGNRGGPGHAGQPDNDDGQPTPPPIGGAPGYFQFVFPDGRVTTPSGAKPKPRLPVDSRVLAVAHGGSGFYTSATVNGTHVELFTVYDRFDHKAVEVALPLTEEDSVLHGLALTYVILIAVGVVLAGLLGTVIARTALAPINRFTERTEKVTSELTQPRRLEEAGGLELQRLAASFNQTLDALERSVQAQRHLIADASHELRTPMAALRSNIQIFLDSERLPEDDRRELQWSIIAELDELTQLVADVLELARGDSPSDHTESIELDAVVSDAVESARRRAPTITFDMALEPTIVTGSPDRVTRAVTNVIDNARKWSPPDGAIEVSLHGGVLTVRDHGPGFGEGDVAHVFDRFYRADGARRMPGSGLGLAIVKQAAEAHGGFARAANAPGGGALLTVSFGRR